MSTKLCSGRRWSSWPDFLDEYWIHDGNVSDIFKTVKYGVPHKGMISWENRLQSKEMAHLARFIKLLERTLPQT